MLLDLEPYVPTNKNAPRLAAQLLVGRAQSNHPGIKYHIFFDSGFGSFDEMDYYCSKNVLTTMSLSSNQWDWLFDLMGADCPLEAGRTASVPLPLSKTEILANIYFTKSDTGKIIDIRTISSGFDWKVEEMEEVSVARVGGRRVEPSGAISFETFWVDGDTTWEPSTAFMDEDGTFNVIWLEKATSNDLVGALMTLSQAKLVLICETKGYKVPLFAFTLPS